ncbi:unnamed protein product [Porites lobata]|uniref:Uncharacterized protein n=1 Tax=Porites lobata TaxID=104759 RepID=A0ABN8NUU3_9CNID|nr:unnamed protein product [Porites lobata]
MALFNPTKKGSATYFLDQNHGNSMEFHGIPWNSVTTSWNSVELHGIPWNSMDTPWNSMAFHGTPWILHGYSMEVPWNSMDFHRFPWISMEFHGIP